MMNSNPRYIKPEARKQKTLKINPQKNKLLLKAKLQKQKPLFKNYGLFKATHPFYKKMINIVINVTDLQRYCLF